MKQLLLNLCHSWLFTGKKIQSSKRKPLNFIVSKFHAFSCGWDLSTVAYIKANGVFRYLHMGHLYDAFIYKALLFTGFGGEKKVCSVNSRVWSFRRLHFAYFLRFSSLSLHWFHIKSSIDIKLHIALMQFILWYTFICISYTILDLDYAQLILTYIVDYLYIHSIRSIVCLNLPSFSGGLNPWGTPNKNRSRDVSFMQLLS